MTVPDLRHPGERAALAHRLRHRGADFSAVDEARHRCMRRFIDRQRQNPEHILALVQLGAPAEALRLAHDPQGASAAWGATQLSVLAAAVLQGLHPQASPADTSAVPARCRRAPRPWGSRCGAWPTAWRACRPPPAAGQCLCAPCPAAGAPPSAFTGAFSAMVSFLPSLPSTTRLMSIDSPVFRGAFRSISITW
jgi:hypothetical protein